MNERYEIVKKAMAFVRKNFKVATRSYATCCSTCTAHSIESEEYIFAKLFKSGCNQNDFSRDSTFDTVYLAWDLRYEKMVDICKALQAYLGEVVEVVIPATSSSSIKLVFKKEEQTNGNV